MEIKTSKLIGDALDWAVQAAQYDYPLDEVWEYRNDAFKPSTNWAQGGPIIEREGLGLEYDREWMYDPAAQDPDDEPDNGDRWRADYNVGGYQHLSEYGPTPLIAAMRCYVASKLGDEVEVPDELLS